MTYREDAPWPSYADFLALPLRERILQVRTMLGLNQDEFAAAVGSKSGRHAVVQWEKHGREPREFAEGIAALTPYPADAFRQAGVEGVTLATIDLRLRAVEAAVADGTARILAAVESVADRIGQRAAQQKSGVPQSGPDR